MHFPRHLLISLIILYFVGCTISFSSIVSRIDYSFHAEDRNSLTLLSQVLTQFHERWNISLVFLSCDCKVDSYLSVAASVSSSWMTPIAILCKDQTSQFTRKVVDYKLRQPNTVFLSIPASESQHLKQTVLHRDNNYKVLFHTQHSFNIRVLLKPVLFSDSLIIGENTNNSGIPLKSEHQPKFLWSFYISFPSTTSAVNCSSVFKFKTDPNHLEALLKNCVANPNSSSGSINKHPSIDDPDNLFSSNSLIFISKASEDQLASIVDPVTLASWIGIITGYLATVIIFGTMKSITVWNFDESCYNFAMGYLTKLFYNDSNNGLSEQKPLSPEDQCKSESRIKRTTGTTATSLTLLGLSQSEADVESGNCKSIIGLASCSCSPGTEGQFEHDLARMRMDNNGGDDKIGANDVQHGRPSKVILHGTIRLVSFLLIAAYEGKLYNAVTFPKSGLVTTVQDLVDSGKYSVKMTRVVKSHGIFNNSNSTVFRNQNLNGHGALEFCRTSHNNDHESEHNKCSEFRSGKNRQHSNIFNNMEDCIDWMESSSDKRFACVGYEFELRNLHKSHRFDKLITTKSNGNRMSFERVGRWSDNSKNAQGNKGQMFRYRTSRSAMAMTKSFKISKFPFHFMESGLSHLYRLAQNTFTDSMLDEKLASSSSDIFTIKDNSGLSAVFVVLVLVSCILFIGENVFYQVKRRMGKLQSVITCFSDSFTTLVQIIRNYCVGKKKHNRVYNY